MRMHSIGIPPVAANIVPLSAHLNRAKEQETSQSDSADHAQTAFTQFDSGTPDDSNDAIDHDAAVASGQDGTQATPNLRPDANPVTQQAPAAASLVGVAVYNYQGQLQKLHPGAGQSLQVSA